MPLHDGKRPEKMPSRSRGRPTQADAAANEKLLLSVALREFLRHGYGGTSMAQIVKAARVSKTTLYSRFASKEALFRAIVHQQIGEMAPESVLVSDTGRPDLKTGLTDYANRMLELSLRGDMLGVNRLMYSESARFPELGAAAGERTDLGIKRIAEFVKRCATSDGIRCEDPTAVAEVFILMVRGWYVNVMLTNRKVTPAHRRAWVERAVHALVSARPDW
jgi:TetR/AcrR family transcriptional repressor of mexJK operon